MSLLVTGGTGFVMSNFVRHWLESEPEATAVILDSAPWDGAADRFFAPVRDRLSFVRGDVLEAAAWENLPAGITRVLHGATITPTDEREKADPRSIMHVNTMGTVNALEWARRRPMLQRFIYVSSGSVYSELLPQSPEALVRETDAIEPDGLYGISKIASEWATQRYGELFGLDTASVRFSTVYGPMDRDTPARTSRSAPYRLVHYALQAAPISIRSLDAGGDWIHAQDVARALAGLLRAPALRHQTYNVANGRWASIGDLVDIVREAVPGLEWTLAPATEAIITHDPAHRLGRWSGYDVSRLQEEFGWEPRPLRAALQDYIAWVGEHETG